MKRLIIFLLLIISGILYANPIQEDLIITEIKFNESDWQIELFSEFLDGATNLDSCQIICNAGSSYFQSGIEIGEYSYIVVTKNDLITPLTIDKNGDFINFIFPPGQGSHFTFGTLDDMVLAPSESQSLRAVALSINAGMTTDLIFAKDNTPSIGETDDNLGFTGIFSGDVYDSEMNLLSNVEISYTPDCISLPDIISDENGHFEVELYAFNYDCHISLASLASMDTIISIEPDSTNFYQFVFQNYSNSEEHEIPLPTSSYQLSSFPNPFYISNLYRSTHATISFALPKILTDVSIEIFNPKGQLIRVLEAENLSLGNNEVIWDGTDNSSKQPSSGIYLYKLVADGKELSINKMIILK